MKVLPNVCNNVYYSDVISQLMHKLSEFWLYLQDIYNDAQIG